MINAIIQENAGHMIPGRAHYVRPAYFTIGGEQKPILFEHAPYERLSHRVAITPATEHLWFEIALDPSVYPEGKVVGDGVEFLLEARDARGTVTRLYDRYIDPKHNPEERKWIPAEVDLAKFIGQTVDLLFTTLPGPRNDSAADWAGWGNPRFAEHDAAELPAFREIYHKEALIYEYDDVLPRAAIFHNVEIAADEKQALARLTDPAVDVMRTAVVEAGDLGQADRAAISRMQQGGPAEAARITGYSSRRVAITASLREPGLLMLNDSNYPGWKVAVDGNEGNWIATDYLFRGVLLGAGEHRVEFRYTPDSFLAGLWISGGTAALIAGWLVIASRKRVRVPASALLHNLRV
jgi:hypothetical protein